jgi:hypothetical protein
VYVAGHAFGGMSEGIPDEKLCSQFSSVAKDLMHPHASKEDVKGVRNWILRKQCSFLCSDQHEEPLPMATTHPISGCIT